MAGRRETASLGTIEQRHRFTWMEPDGNAHGGFSDLREAQQAAESTDHGPANPPARRWPLVVGVVALALGFVALGWVVGMILPG